MEYRDVPKEEVQPGDIAHHHTLDPREVAAVDHGRGGVSLHLLGSETRYLPLGNYTYTRKVPTPAYCQAVIHHGSRYIDPEPDETCDVEIPDDEEYCPAHLEEL